MNDLAAQMEVLRHARRDSDELADMFRAQRDVAEARCRQIEEAARAMHDAFMEQFSHHTMAGPTIEACMAFERVMSDPLLGQSGDKTS